MRIYAAAALVAYSAAIKMRALEDDEPTDDWENGEWQDPCFAVSPCHEIAERDPCAGSDWEDTEEWEQCHADNAEWGNELKTCLEAKTEEQWAELLECMEEHPIDGSEESGDDLAQTSGDDESSSWSSEDDLAQSGDEVEDGPGSNWSEGEWQDPCEQFATCKPILEADPCGDLASDSDAWEECHEGTEGQEWAEEL